MSHIYTSILDQLYLDMKYIAYAIYNHLLLLRLEMHLFGQEAGRYN